MVFIFGWNHTKITNFGPVEQQQCENCHNTDFWQLRKISKYFTLFFIPVIPHDNENFYHCPICNYGLSLQRDDFESYKAIAELNKDCLEKKITEEDRSSKLEEIHKGIKDRNETSDLKASKDSKKWANVVAERSSEELQIILDKKSAEYDSGFIVAAKNELGKRKQM